MAQARLHQLREVVSAVVVVVEEAVTEEAGAEEEVTVVAGEDEAATEEALEVAGADVAASVEVVAEVLEAVVADFNHTEVVEVVREPEHGEEVQFHQQPLLGVA